MTKLLLIPLEDTVVFPGMDVTLPVDVGDESRVLLVPRHGSEYAHVGLVAEVGEHIRLPGRIHAVSLSGLHRGVAGAANTDPEGRLWVEVDERPDETPPPSRTRELEREYRAVVEEILELRGDDGRVSAFVRSINDPGALADTSGYAPDLNFDQKVELLQTIDVVERLELALRLQRDRLAELAVRKRIRDDVESGAQKQQREYFLRKQMDSIRKELGDDDASVAEEYRRKIAEAGMPDDVREQAEREVGTARADGRVHRRVLDDPHLPRLADRRAVVEALGRAARPGARPRGARRRPRRSRRRQGADHRVPGGAQAACRPRRPRRPPLRRHPDADRPSGHRQDLDRRVDRPRHGARVRAHVARRRARRGRDPRTSPHLHRRPAGTAGARAARRRHDEPGDHAGRGRQGRRRLARRPLLGPARGARPGPEPLVPRPLPGRRARPVAGARSSPPPTWPTRSPARCSTGWR